MIVRLFTKGFYKKYANILFLGFCLVFSYCFFIETAGAIKGESRDTWTLFIAMKVVTDPLFLLLFIILSVLYSFVCVRYIERSVKEKQFHFLRYSFEGMSIRNRLKDWVATLFLMQLPVFLFGLYSHIVGYFLDHSRYSFFILCILCVLNITGAIYLLFTVRPYQKPIFFLGRTFIKRYVPLSLYFMPLLNQIYHQKKAFAFSKLLTLGVIYLFVNLGSDRQFDTRLTILVTMIIACMNTVLLYKNFLFERQFLSFTLNLPFRPVQRLLFPICYHFFLIVIEAVYVSFTLGGDKGIIVMLGGILFHFFIHKLLLFVGNNAMMVIKTMLVFFLICVLFILYDAVFCLLSMLCIATVILFYKYYGYKSI